MTTPDPTPLLAIPGWWFVWFVLTAVLTVGLAFITALAKSGKSPAAPPPAPIVVDQWGYPLGTTMTATAPPIATGILAHPFVLWVMWLFGSWAAYMALSFLVFVIFNLVLWIHS